MRKGDNKRTGAFPDSTENSEIDGFTLLFTSWVIRARSSYFRFFSFIIETKLYLNRETPFLQSQTKELGHEVSSTFPPTMLIIR